MHRRLRRLSGDHAPQPRIGRADHLCVAILQALLPALLAHDNPGVRIRQHVPQPLLRITHIQWEVNTSGLQDPQHPRHRRRAASQARPHHHLASDSEPAQEVCDAVGFAFQLCPPYLNAPIQHGDGLWIHRRKGRDQLVQQQRTRSRYGRLIHSLDEHAPLRLIEHRQLAQRAFRMCADCAQQRHEASCPVTNRCRVEQVRRVFEQALEPGGPRLYIQGNIELRDPVVVLQRRGRHRRQHCFIGRRVLQHQQHLEQRLALRVLLRPQLGGQFLERHVLVRIRSEGRLLHTFQQLRERLLALQLRAQYHSIDEEPDESFQLPMASACYRGSDDDIPLTREAPQQHLKRREQDHEQGDIAAARELLQRLRLAFRKLHPVQRALEARLRRTRPVARQLQSSRRRPGQLAPPVIQLPLQRFSLQPEPLPQCIVRVLQRQLWQWRFLSLAIGCIERADLPHQHAYRPSVHDYVVHRQQQNVLLLAQLQQHRLKQRSVCQVQTFVQLPLHAAAYFLLARLPRLSAQVPLQQCKSLRGLDHLHC